MFTITSADLPCDKEDLELVISTESSTMSRVVLPSHHLKITLEDLSPSFPQVTDDSEFGYFKRLLSRTRRINLDEEPETEEPDAIVCVIRVFINICMNLHILYLLIDNILGAISGGGKQY